MADRISDSNRKMLRSTPMAISNSSLRLVGSIPLSHRFLSRDIMMPYVSFRKKMGMWERSTKVRSRSDASVALRSERESNLIASCSILSPSMNLKLCSSSKN